MIKQILKQIWNRRRSNTWIFIELILVTFFLWRAIDPVFILETNRAIDKGYDLSNTFRLTVGEYPSTHGKYEAEHATDSMRRVNFLRIYDRLRNYPDISAAVITMSGGYPSSDSYSGTSFFADSVKHPMQYYNYYSDGEYFKVFGMEDNMTGNPDSRSSDMRSVYLTGDAERELFGDESGLNRIVFKNDSTHMFRVAGIVDNFKTSSMEQPTSLIFETTNELSLDQGFPFSMQFCFRVRDGVSPQVFGEKFRTEFMYRYNQGNYYLLNLNDFETIQLNYEFTDGHTNTLRMQTSLAVFFLMCTFLGVAGTFWLRAGARRGEIGLRMALGSTRKEILRDFLTESWLITTLAWLVGLFFVFQLVYHAGFTMQYQLTDNMEYIQNRPVIHFTIISFMVYLFLVVITFLGTWIPANRAANTKPADTLRDE